MQKDVSSLQNYVQTNCPSVVPIVPLFKSNFANKGYCLLEASSLSAAKQTLYKHSHFFCSLLNMPVCIISRGYTQCDFCGPDLLPFKKIFTCTHDTFLVPNGQTVRNNGLKFCKKIYLHIDVGLFLLFFF